MPNSVFQLGMSFIHVMNWWNGIPGAKTFVMKTLHRIASLALTVMLAGCASSSADSEGLAASQSDLRASASQNRAADRLKARLNNSDLGFFAGECKSFGTSTRIVVRTYVAMGGEPAALVNMHLSDVETTLDVVVKAQYAPLPTREGSEYSLSFTVLGTPYTLEALQTNARIHSVDADIPMRCDL
jgi:hypothetical protein